MTGPGSIGAVRRRKPVEFQMPDGRKVIVALPDEVDFLRQRYASLTAANDDYTRANDAIVAAAAPDGSVPPSTHVEIVLHGSREHHSYLSETHAHTAARKAAMRSQLGAHLADEWEAVYREMAALQAHLDRLGMDEAAEGLGENFSKFGYDAQLRTFGEGVAGGKEEDDEESAYGSESTASAWESRAGGSTLKLFKKPMIRQYFHKGLLWRASEHYVPGSIELFLDLFYVGIIHTNGEYLTETPTANELHRFVITFIMSWRIWCDIALVMSWFENDDIFQRIELLWELSCLLGFTTNMIYATDAEHSSYTLLVSFYLAARLFIAVHCVLTAFLLPLVRGAMLSHALVTAAPAAVWIGSIYVDLPNRYVLIWIAIFMDLYGTAPVIALFQYSRRSSSSIARWAVGFFEFFPALNIEHKVERTNAFVCMVLGYSVVAVMFQSWAPRPTMFLGKAVLGLLQAYAFNWLYFDCDGANIYVHAIRRSAVATSLWQQAHIIFVLGYITATSALSSLVVAHDGSAETSTRVLAESYAERSEEHLANGVRFFYCHGLAVALLGLVTISLSHTHRLLATRRMPKKYRLAVRVAAALVLFLLPMAKNLRSIDMVGISTGLLYVVLAVEVWGISCTDDPFVGEKEGCGTQKYFASCSKKALQKAKTEEGEVDVEALGKNAKLAVDFQA